MYVYFMYLFVHPRTNTGLYKKFGKKKRYDNNFLVLQNSDTYLIFVSKILIILTLIGKLHSRW